jgi:hypothetical protein
MNSHNTPGQTPQSTTHAEAAAEAQLQAWVSLRDQMQALHAELEYVRLMLKLGVPTL